MENSAKIYVAGHRGLVGSAIVRRLEADGIPRKLLDCSLLAALGWEAKISLRDGIEATYRWFLEEGDF